MRLHATQRIDAGNGADDRPLFVMFHGYGNDEDEMVRIIEAVHEGTGMEPDWITFRATYARPYMGGNYWYPDGCGVGERRRECSAVGDAVVSMMDSSLLRGRRKVLVGFSQGGYLSYRISVEHPGVFDAAVLLSPSFKGEEDAQLPVESAQATHYVLAYGALDRTIPPRDQLNARAVLAHADRFDMLEYPGMGHAICDGEIADLRRLLVG